MGLLVALAACGTEPTEGLGGTRDAGHRDAGFLERDAGTIRDGGSVRDGGTAPRDGGVRRDGGPIDAGNLACTGDDDCAPSGWCRSTMSGDRACTPWAQEGERCGGDTVPWAQERCDPTLICFDSIISSAPGNCVIEATVRALLNAPARYDGHAVGLASFDVVIGPVGCTLRPCTPEDPCCNDCEGELQAEDRVGAGSDLRLSLVAPDGTPYVCAGDECNWQDQCELTPGPYRAWGGFSAGPPPSLNVVRIEPRP